MTLVAKLQSTDTAARREVILRLIRARSIATQAELQSLLRQTGFEATQATLSRDLAKVGARRAPQPGGGAVYEAPEDSLPVRLESFRAIRGLVDAIVENGALVVVRTRPGAASAVARVIDLARLAECAGSLAGDDTIFVAPARGVRSNSLARKLSRLLQARPPV